MDSKWEKVRKMSDVGFVGLLKLKDVVKVRQLHIGRIRA